MNLKITHNRTAKWANEAWLISDEPSYHWENKTHYSPIFLNLSDALVWVIKYDEEKAQEK